jgi:ATP-binding cassette subfamily B (MDR/TAP) protein 1
VPFLFFFFGDLIDLFGQREVLGPSANEQFLKDVQVFVWRFVFMGIGAFCASYISVLCMSVSGERQSHRVRKLYVKSLIYQDIGWYDMQRSGALANSLGEYYVGYCLISEICN